MTAPVLYAGDPRLLNKAGLLERVAELLEAEERYVERIKLLERTIRDVLKCASAYTEAEVRTMMDAALLAAPDRE